MSLEPIKHYSTANPATAYDEESLTVLELVGRIANKFNSLLAHFNLLTAEYENLDETTKKALADMDTKILDATSKWLEEMAQSGYFDHVLIEHASELEQRLDNLILEINPNIAEIVDARAGNGGVTYATLGEAIRKQTTDIKPVRLSPEGGEWRKDTQEVPHNMTYQNSANKLSGFDLTSGSMNGYRSYTYKVVPGEEYIMLNPLLSEEDSKGANAGTYYAIFTDNLLNPVIGHTEAHKFITGVDYANHIYRIKIPDSCSRFTTLYEIGGHLEFWRVIKNQKMEWLKVDGDNIEGASVTPAHLDRKPGTWTRDVDFTRVMHTYKVMQNPGTKINNANTNGICLVTLENVIPGEVYRIPQNKDVYGSLQTYFVFEAEDGTGAIPVLDIGVYVKKVAGSSYEYLVTIPEKCVKFHTAFDAGFQPTIKEVVETTKLPWLKVGMENLDENVVTQMQATAPGRRTMETIRRDRLANAPRRIYIFGDSISAGVNSTSKTEHASGTSPIVAWLEQKYPSAYGNIHNYSVSGSKSGGVYATMALDGGIPEDVSSTDMFVFAYGINDYRGGTEIGSLATMSQSENFIGYTYQILHTLYDLGVFSANANVVFITPINYCGDPVNNPYGTLDDYRYAMYKACTYFNNNVTVIDGGSIGFPETYDDFAELVIKDGLHPSAKGATFYASKLLEKTT